MATVLLPILPGTLPQGACPANNQELLVLFANNMQALLANGGSYYNFGPDKPAPQYQSFPWLRTQDGRWYYYGTGGWSAPMNHDPSERRIWVGTLVGAGSLEYYDGGSPGTVSSVSGPAWEVDADFSDRIPIGVGTIVAAVGGTAGAKEQTISLANINHWHGVGTDGGTDDPPNMISRAWAGTENFTRRINDLNATSGSGWHDDATPMTNGTMGSTGPQQASSASTPLSIVPPVIGVYVVKPTIRAFYVVA